MLQFDTLEQFKTGLYLEKHKWSLKFCREGESFCNIYVLVEFPKYLSAFGCFSGTLCPNSLIVFISKYPTRMLCQSSISESEEAVPALNK